MKMPCKNDFYSGNQTELDERIASDELLAIQHFFNKSQEEAEELFFNNTHVYVEDLMFMGKKAFDYYAMSYLNFLKKNNSDILHNISLLNMLLEYRNEYEVINLFFKKECLIYINGLSHSLQDFMLEKKEYIDLKSKLEIIKQKYLAEK